MLFPIGDSSYDILAAYLEYCFDASIVVSC